MRVDWRGIVAGLSTVTDDEGELDEEGIRNQVRFDLDKGAHGLAVSIMAGEFHKFSDAERMKAFEIVVDEANTRVPVLAGVSHSGTNPAMMLAKHAKDVGVDGIILMPAYFERIQSSLSLHEQFSTILSKVDIPMMIQDAEDVVGVHMCPTLYARLAKEYSHVVSIKVEGARTLEKIQEIRGLLGDELVIFGGMAAKNMLKELQLGAKGNIADSCLIDLLVQVYEDHVAGNANKAKEIFERYKLWVDFLFLHMISASEIEKETLRLRGVIKSSHTRPPGIALDESDRAELKYVLQKMSMIP